MQENKPTIKYQKAIAKFLELLIWTLIVGIIITSIVLYNSYSHKHFNRYQVFFQDVDGVIVGSPVRMLGIQVGYVKHIKFVHDMVYVDFIITEKDVEVPKGTRVTVEFSGLGGSKSLELYPPTQKVPNASPSLYIQQPRRLGAALSLLDSMFETLGQITYKCTSFANKLNSGETINHSGFKTNNNFMNIVNEWLDDRLKKENKEQE
jgi:ABC-type transporter Mla subunit MlaD